MGNSKFDPINNIEAALIQARKGEITLPKLIDIFLNEKFFVPSLSSVGKNGDGFSPMLFERGDLVMTAIFTDGSRAEIHRGKIKDMVILSFKDILKNIPENYGLVINPGYSEGLEIFPHGIKNIKRDFLRK